MEYLDFDLEVTAADGGTYTVRVLRSPAGEASGTMRLPFDDLVLQNRLQALQIALLRSGTTRRRIQTAESHTVETFGQELWGALFSGEIGARFEASRDEARRLDAGMRIKLRFDDAALAALPWEYLFDASRGDYVTLSSSTPVVRYIPLPQIMVPLAVRPPLRVLGMIASPSDLDALDVDRERLRLGKALEAAGAGLVELVWMTGSTARDLQGMLRRGPWHIFHFVGHGGFDANRGEGLIVLTSEDGKASQVSATDLGRLLGDHDPLRLAVLNACESARGDALDVFASTAATLVRRGTPAVVAMQYEITDDAAIEFSRSFYEAIADGIPVDAALAEARKGVAMAIPGTLEWGTPVLYMRAPDGVLFDIPAEARAAAVAAQAPAAEGTAVPPAAAAPPEVVAAATPAVPVVPAAVVEPQAVAPAPVVPAEPVAPTTVIAAPDPVVQPAAAATSAPAPTPAAPATRSAPDTVSGWTAPAAAATRGSSGTTVKVLVVGLVVLVVVAAAIASALSSDLGGGVGTALPTADPGPLGGLRSADPAVFGGPAALTDRPIVFANDAGGNTDLFSVDPTSGAAVRLTDDPADDRHPAWSPDGRRIAFTRLVDGRGDLWVMRADGSDQIQLTDGVADDFEPSWTPDGSRLIFTSDRSETDGRSNDVWTIGLDGSDPQLIVGVHARDDGTAALSPDGGHLAFSSDRDGDARSIYLEETATADVTRMTFSGWVDREPDWSPGGNAFVFTRASELNLADGDLWLIRTDDGSVTQLTTDDADEGHPTFSPDGTNLAFQRIVAGSYHVLVDGAAGVHDLTSGLGGNSIEPSW